MLHLKRKLIALAVVLGLGATLAGASIVTQTIAPSAAPAIVKSVDKADAMPYTAYYYDTNCGYYEVTYGTPGLGTHFTASASQNYLWGNSSGTFSAHISHGQGAPIYIYEYAVGGGTLYYSYAGFHRYC